MYGNEHHERYEYFYLLILDVCVCRHTYTVSYCDAQCVCVWMELSPLRNETLAPICILIEVKIETKHRKTRQNHYRLLRCSVILQIPFLLLSNFIACTLCIQACATNSIHEATLTRCIFHSVPYPHILISSHCHKSFSFIIIIFFFSLLILRLFSLQTTCDFF